MKLKQEIVDRLNNPPARRRISARLKSCGDQAIYKHLKGNSENGRLTKMDALKAISEETGLSIGEILDDSSVNGLRLSVAMNGSMLERSEKPD